MTSTSGHRDRPTELGVVRINNDAIITIASTAAMEVRGVCKMGGGLRNAILEMIHGRSFGGVRVSSTDGEIKLVVFVIVHYGIDIPRVADEVQDSVKHAVEKMTGLVIGEVDVVVEGVYPPAATERDKKRDKAA